MNNADDETESALRFKLPRNANEAMAMSIYGEGWLKENTPHLMRPQSQDYEFVKMVGRLSHSADEDYLFPDDPEETLEAMNRLIARAREIMSIPRKAHGGGSEQ